jgi:hypothetical protein
MIIISILILLIFRDNLLNLYKLLEKVDDYGKIGSLVVGGKDYGV